MPLLPHPYPDCPGLRQAKLEEKLSAIYRRPEYRAGTASPSTSAPVTPTTAQLSRRFFPGPSPETARKKASRWLMKQRLRRVRVAGAVLLGRAALMFGPPGKPDLLEHQVCVTEAELLLGAEFDRDVPVGRTATDSMFRKGGHLFAVEVDNAGKQGRAQYRVMAADKDVRRRDVDLFVRRMGVFYGPMAVRTAGGVHYYARVPEGVQARTRLNFRGWASTCWSA